MSDGRIPREFIDELLLRVDIVDLIDARVPLKKTGANYVARCPFHAEKTPSFSVNQKKQFFHCFGCGVSGNAISFLMEFNHLDFVEAVEDLAAFAGLAVPRESDALQARPDKTDLKRLYLLMEQVAAFYVQSLRTSAEGKKAVAYLKSREIDGDAARDFMLGYAPGDWRTLLAGFDRQMLIEAGLLGSNENGDVYARFRNRLMFPIRDKRGRIIGFGGRVLDTSLPKYLNSPETPLFHKGRQVYGLYELLKKNAKPQRILLVEGYMDVIALAQSGIGYAVAALGTATSQAHVELLFRFAPELVFCFDGDNAGREAAWKAMEAVFPSLKDGRQVRVLLLPQHHDPDSLVREEGAGRVVERIETAKVLSDYFFGCLAEDFDLSAMEGRAQLINKAKPYLIKMPDGVFKEMMFTRLKELSASAKLDVLKNPATLNPMPDSSRRRKNSRPPLERQALALLIQNPILIERLEEKDVDWGCLDFQGVEKFMAILQVILDEKPANTAILLEYYRNHADESIVKQLALLKLEVPVDGIEAEFCGALDKLLAHGRDAVFKRLLMKLETEGLSQQEIEDLQKLTMLRNKNSLVQNKKIL